MVYGFLSHYGWMETAAISAALALTSSFLSHYGWMETFSNLARNFVYITKFLSHYGWMETFARKYAAVAVIGF